MRYYIYILIIILLSFSCKKKEDKNTVSGNVSSSVSGNSISSGTAYLYGQKVSSGAWNASYSLLGQSAIEGGSFKIEVEVDNITSFRLDITKNNFFTKEIFYTTENFIDNSISSNYTIDPSAEITIIVNNTSPKNSDDFFKYKITKGYAEYDDACGKTRTFIGQTQIDTTICKVIGDQEVIFSNIWEKNNVGGSNEVTEYCASGTNTKIIINY